MLAEKARAALSGWHQVQVSNTDGAQTAFDPVDVIIVSAGATHPLPSWLNALRPGGRLLFPMTTPPRGLGAMLLERCIPGTALSELPEPDQDSIIAGLLRRLWRKPAPPLLTDG